MPDWVRLRQAAWGLGLVLNGNKVISNSAAVGVSSGLRCWHSGSLPVDLVVVVLLEGTGSHGSRVGVEALASCPGILRHVPPSSTVSSRNP